MHFSYVKTKFLHRWLNILCNYVHSRTFSTPKINPPPTTMPPPPPQPRHQTLQATLPYPPSHPASHLTWPTTPPGPPPPTLLAFSGRDTTASLSLPRAGAILVILQRLYVWGAGQPATLSNILHAPSNILHTVSNILSNLSNILRTPSNNLRTPSNII